MFSQLSAVDVTTNTETITSTETLTADSDRIQVLTPSGGPINVVLPAEEGNGGLHFTIINKSATQNLVIKDDAAATVMTVLPSMSGVVFLDEDEAWQVLFNSGTYSAVTLTAPTINGASSASGNFDLSGSTGTFLSCTGANTLGGAVTVNAATTPSITTASGKTNTGFVTINGKTDGALKLTCADSTSFTLTVSAAQQSGAATLTIPDLGGVAQSVAMVGLAQTLTNKTLTTPVINGATAASGNFDLSGSSGTFKSNTGANTLGGAVTVNAATTPYLTTAAGKTNTGYLEVSGKTSGSLQITTADATAFTLVLSAAAQTVAGATLTIPDFASVNDTFAFLTLAQTFAGVKTFSAAPIVTVNDASNNTVTDLLTLTHTTSGAPGAGIGSGLAFQIEDDGNTEEQASIDAVLATVTNGAEDCDLIVKLNLNGDMQQAFKLDSVNQTAVIGQNSTDADGMQKLTIYPVTASRGSLVFSAVAHASADRSTTVQTATDAGAAVVLTLPNATGTLACSSTANTYTAVQTVAIDDATNNGTTDLLVLKHTTSGGPSASMGAGVSIIVENDTDATTEVANVDWVMTNDGTKAALDVDTVFANMVAGASTTLLRLVADETGAGGAKLVQFGSDANQVSLDVHPATTASGTLRITAADSAGDTVTTITNASQSGARTYTIPDAGASASFAMTAGTTNFTGRVTTTDAVGSGTAKVVGGLAYALAAAGTAHTNSTDEAELANYHIPANTIKEGTVIKVRYQGIATAQAGATTLTVNLRLGTTTLTGTVLMTHAAHAVTANDIFNGEFTLVGRAVPGAAAAVVGFGTFGPTAVGFDQDATLGQNSKILASTNFATNGELHLQLTADWSAADASSCRADIFNVEIY